MTSAAEVLAIARSQIGTVEDGQGRQKYGAWYGMNGPAWCAMFQQWCFNQAGGSALIPRTAYTPTFWQWFVNVRQTDSSPRAGDLVFYDWPDSERRVQHVGIVESVDAGARSFVAIEGNTTSGQAGDQSHGGGVWRRRRARTYVVGFGTPNYAAGPAPAPGGLPGLPAWPSVQMAAGHYFGLTSGPRESHGGGNAWERSYVRALQQRLIGKGFVPGVADWRSGWADGLFEGATADAVTRFQRAQMPGTTLFGQVWADDWAQLAR